MEPFQSSFYRESLPPSAQTSLGEAALPARKSHADGPTTRARGRWPRRLPGTFTPEGAAASAMHAAAPGNVVYGWARRS